MALPYPDELFVEIVSSADSRLGDVILNKHSIVLNC